LRGPRLPSSNFEVQQATRIQDQTHQHLELAMRQSMVRLLSATHIRNKEREVYISKLLDVILCEQDQKMVKR